ncbi:MAG: exodeoxyribonuclease III [Alphaproteobacteria bacterium]|nr:exodeoxyribonuclease III [Alphaproteobacteria bacterium]MDP7190284.1 exodeoxyribonuclease III [Alphaproteobacteria bacterium]HJO88168.1 exodeoxyribonuclease III [Alphaproteobacteria bacterium]
MKIATWNVNSVRARLAHLLGWLDKATPDILLLQEIKCMDDAFPILEIETAGYNCAVRGQKSYNGVAILSRTPLEDVITELPGDSCDEQARYVEAVTEFSKGVIRVASLYLPNGNPVDGEKYPYKLAWMERLTAHAGNLLTYEEPLVLGGDYNVIPRDDDVYNPEAWREDALACPEIRREFRALLHLGFTDAVQTTHPDGSAYTFWDYKGGVWKNDHGLRLDHLLLSPQAADRLFSCGIDRGPRGLEKPSDHTPVWCELEETSPY